MEWVVTTGRTVEEALETALDQLGVDEQDAEMEVLQEPQKGLFGRLRAEAQVRARVRPSAPPPKVDRRERRRKERSGGGRREGGGGDRPRSRSRNRTGGRAAENGREGRAPAGAGAGATGAAASTAASTGGGAAAPAEPISGGRGESGPRTGGGEAARGQGGARRRRRGSGREGGNAEGAGVVSESSTTTAEAETLDIEAQRAAVEEFLRGLVDAFGREDATVTVAVAEDEDDTLEAAVEGTELGVLVGQKGVTLQSLQELVRSMVQRRFVGQAHARVRVDVAGYRERRRAALERFTVDVATSVRESGVAKALDPMGAADRKVIHDAVNAIEGVETVSEGQDADRHVVIRPSA